MAGIDEMMRLVGTDSTLSFLESWLESYGGNLVQDKFLCVKPKLVTGSVVGSFTCSFAAIRMKTLLNGSNMMVILGCKLIFCKTYRVFVQRGTAFSLFNVDGVT